MMFHIALYQPEIPQNTGNIIRLCANTGAELHLIHPLGFILNDKNLQRAGLDYHQHVTIHEYKNFESFLEKFPKEKIFAIETCGKKIYSENHFQSDDVLLFGPETRGLPSNIIEKLIPENILIIPMKKNIRSINLCNSVAITLYEAWRQNNFE